MQSTSKGQPSTTRRCSSLGVLSTCPSLDFASSAFHGLPICLRFPQYRICLHPSTYLAYLSVPLHVPCLSVGTLACTLHVPCLCVGTPACTLLMCRHPDMYLACTLLMCRHPCMYPIRISLVVSSVVPILHHVCVLLCMCVAAMCAAPVMPQAELSRAGLLRASRELQKAQNERGELRAALQVHGGTNACVVLCCIVTGCSCL